MLKIEDLCFKYGDRRILKGARAVFEKGVTTAILGANGSGKTTLLKNIAGILKPSSGAVFVDGNDIASVGPDEISKIFGYMPQTSHTSSFSVFDAVLLGRKPYIGWKVKNSDITAVEGILDTLGISDLAFRPASELSGGELQKVVLARALAQEPSVLLLDEPTNHLDIKNQFDVMRLISRVTREKNIASIAVMHDVNLALRFCGGFVMMREGSIHAAGPNDIITSENIRSVFSIESEIHSVGEDIFVMIK